MSFNSYFVALRTESQLGYIVHSRVRFDHNVVSFSCIIQSASYAPDYLLAQHDAFFTKYFETFSNISEEDVQTNVKSIISKTLEKEKQMKIESVRHWVEIANHQFVFDRRNKKVEAFEKMKKQDLVDFFKNYLLPNGSNYRRMVVMMVAGDKKVNIDDLPKGHNVVLVEDRHTHKHNMPLYPSFTKF